MQIKNLILLILLSLFSFYSQADFGQASSESQWAADAQRVNNLIANSSEYRRSIKVGRSVAGQSAKDLEWAQEFEDLMNSTEDIDYLELALKL